MGSFLLSAESGPSRASPVPTTTFCTFHFPYAGGFFDTRSRFPGVFHGLHPNPHRLGSLYFLLSQNPLRRCRIRFMLRTAHLVHLASTQASLPKPEVSLPRTLASPWTGLAPASYRELVARLRHFYLLVLMTSELLDARGFRLSDGRTNRARGQPESQKLPSSS